MFCPRCNTELPEGAYACSQCGTVVSTALPVSSAAQAATTYPPAQSGPAVTSPYQPPSFSYLPAGAPQWPAYVPTNIANMAYAPGQDQPGTLASDQAGASAEKLPGRKSTLGAPAILLLFLVSILIGGGLTYGLLALGRGNTQAPTPITLHPASTAAASPGAASPTPSGNQLPTPASFLTVTNQDVGISVKYPSDWVLDPPQKTTQSAYLDMHPSQQNGLIMNLERYTSSASNSFKSTNDVNDNNIAQLQGVTGLTNFQSVQPTAPQQAAAGVQWDEKDVTFNNSNGLLFHFATIAVHYKNQYYDIFYSAPGSEFNEAFQKYFQPMLSSLKFLT